MSTRVCTVVHEEVQRSPGTFPCSFAWEVCDHAYKLSPRSSDRLGVYDSHLVLPFLGPHPGWLNRLASSADMTLYVTNEAVTMVGCPHLLEHSGA